MLIGSSAAVYGEADHYKFGQCGIDISLEQLAVNTIDETIQYVRILLPS